MTRRGQFMPKQSMKGQGKILKRLMKFVLQRYTPHVIRLGVNDQFVEHGSTKELYHMLKLDKEGLCESLLQVPVK